MQKNNTLASSTKSKPKPSDRGNDALEVTSSRCKWSPADEKILITFLLDYKMKAGDGSPFVAATWSAASEHFQQLSTASEASESLGALKTSRACKNKYQKVCCDSIFDMTAH